MNGACKCGSERRSPDQRYCADCHSAYMRKWRPKHSELTDEQRKKANARSYANVYLNRGKIQRQPCCVEGCEGKPQMHHEDYDYPLDVIWICREHHLELHGST